MKRIDDRRLLDWLEDRAPEGNSGTGYDASGWEASIWILHAMYETDTLPSDITYDEAHRIKLAAGASEPEQIGEAKLEEALSGATLIGGALGRSQRPGSGWERLFWSDLAKRLDLDPFAIDFPPCFRSFPYDSWPVNIQPPAEGSLNREQYQRLVEHLVSVTTEVRQANCVAFYSCLAGSDPHTEVIFEGATRELATLYDNSNVIGSPSNIWPDGREWFVYTDYDLWATKVSGNADLIDRLVADTELETVSLSF